MGIRFPPPLFGINNTESRSQCFVNIVEAADQKLSKDELIERAKSVLTKSDGNSYSTQYLRRIIHTYIQLGVLKEGDDHISVYEFATDWQETKIDFAEFLWSAVKRKWAIEGAFPDGIKGLYDIHQVVKHAESPLPRAEILHLLETDHGYEFNTEGIRGYLPLMENLGALESTERGYVTTAPSRFSERLRNADICWQFEQWLKREGANASPPSDRVKRDLGKYVMYRECGGHGRHRMLLDTAREDYLDDSILTDSASAQLRRADKYIEQRNCRRELRDEITDRFDGIDSRLLSGLSTTALGQIAAASNEEEARRIKAGTGSGLSRRDLELKVPVNRDAYTFPDSFELYEWQREAADRWFESTGSQSEHGIAQVITGAGKTVMALEVLQEWLKAHPDGVVTVVVPTKVLMQQWLQELVETLAVPAGDIGWVGDGQKDEFSSRTRILVTIVNSAIKNDYLETTLDDVGVEQHLLIADECHRYTGEKFSNVFSYHRTAALGLSATPLSNIESDERSPEDEMLIEELGEIYYHLSYDEGLEHGLIPEFRINYVGFELTAAERTAYDRLTDDVVNAVTDIEKQYQRQLYELDGNFAQKLNSIKNSSDTPSPAITDYFEYTQERRNLIADAVARQAITLELLKNALDADKKTIVFQERIKQLERMVAPKETRGRDNKTGKIVETDIDRAQLYEQYPALEQVDKKLEDLFFTSDYRPVMYHSGVRNSTWNDFAIEWFRDDGFANVMLSVKALIEGVDVPDADVGIVRVSSGSIRQRIQTLGRVLRTGDNPDTQSELFVLYARDTVDADIFDKYDWRDELSRADIRHLTWETADNNIEGILRSATDEEIPEPPSEVTIPDSDELSRGDQYDGPQRGFQFSVNAEGEPYRKNGGRQFIKNEAYQEVSRYVHRKKGGGTVTVNSANHAITYLDTDMVFIGVVPDPDDITYSKPQSGGLTDEIDIGLEDLQ
jgi:DNA or RNA helicases of superfamily II